MDKEILTEALKEAYITVKPDLILYETIEISDGKETSNSNDKNNSLYFVHNSDSIAARLSPESDLITFFPIHFSVSLAKISDTPSPKFNLQLENINSNDYWDTGDLDHLLFDATTVYLRYRQFLSNDLTKPSFKFPIELSLQGVTLTENSISISAGYDIDFSKYKFPSKVADTNFCKLLKATL